MLETVNINNKAEQITTYWKRWRKHVHRLGVDRWPRITWNFKPTEQRVRGRLKEILERGL
jgi:hypothetical protein